MLNFSCRRNGFTLIEVVVAIGIFSILSLGCYRIVNGIISAQERIVSHSEKVREISKAIRMMESDFQQIVDRKILDDNGNLLAAYLTDIEGYQSDEIKIEFSRIGLRNPLFVKRAGVVRVSLGYQDEIDQSELEKMGLSDKKSEKDEKTGYILRYVWPVLDRGNNIEPEKQVLLTGVSSFDLEYLDKDRNWVSDWPPLGGTGQKTSDIPYAVRFKITMEKDFFVERVFSMRILPD